MAMIHQRPVTHRWYKNDHTSQETGRDQTRAKPRGRNILLLMQKNQRRERHKELCTTKFFTVTTSALHEKQQAKGERKDNLCLLLACDLPNLFLLSIVIKSLKFLLWKANQMTMPEPEHRAVRKRNLDAGPARPAVVIPTQNPIPLVRFAEQANQVSIILR